MTRTDHQDVGGVTRVDPLPVHLDAEDDAFLLFVGDKKVASAWGPAVDDPDTWFFWNGYSEPYRIYGGRDGALALIEDRREEWQHREDSLWHPDHGPVDEHGYIAKAPTGAGCVGCGENIGGDTFVGILAYRYDAAVTQHYVCANCHPYFEVDPDDESEEVDGGS